VLVSFLLVFCLNLNVISNFLSEQSERKCKLLFFTCSVFCFCDGLFSFLFFFIVSINVFSFLCELS
jgi:hypothetical protein